MGVPRPQPTGQGPSENQHGSAAPADNIAAHKDSPRSGVAAGWAGVNQRLQRLSEQLDIRGREIDHLQLENAERRVPWYKQATTLISAVALVVSVGGTWIGSGYQASAERRADRAERRQQLDQMEADRAALRRILQRLAAAHRDYANAVNRFPGPQAAYITGSLNSEMNLLARQAGEIIQDIPEHVTSPEYYVLATAYEFIGHNDKAMEYTQEAAQEADTLLDAANSLRTYASLEFNAGRVSEGRRRYREAANLRDRFPNENRFIADFYQVLTHAAWGNSEAYFDHCTEASEQMRFMEEVSLRYNLLANPNVSPQYETLKASVVACQQRSAG